MAVFFYSKQPQFPDMRDNYEQTVAAPDREAARLEALRAQQAAQAAIDAAEALKARQTASAQGSGHVALLNAAGVAPSDQAAAEVLVMRESSWNPSAINPSSGACGLAQALPCSKISGNWSDPVTSLRWMNAYVYQSYGGWWQALNFHYRMNWY